MFVPKMGRKGVVFINKGMFKMALIRKGLTQNELAKMLGMTKNTLSNKVNGHTNIYTYEAKRICEILEITDPKEQASIFLS